MANIMNCIFSGIFDCHLIIHLIDLFKLIEWILYEFFTFLQKFV